MIMAGIDSGREELEGKEIVRAVASAKMRERGQPWHNDEVGGAERRAERRRFAKSRLKEARPKLRRARQKNRICLIY